MKINGRNFKVALLTMALIVITAVIVFVYINAISSVHNLKQDISRLQGRFDELTQKNLNKDSYGYELKYINYEMGKVQKLFPPDIVQERIILSLRRIEKASGAKITEITFSAAQKVGKFGVETKNTTEEKEPQFADGDQIEMKVEVSFRAPYNELKEMLNEISQEKNRVIINDISIQREPDNAIELSGKIYLTFCALKDSKRSFDAWELFLEKGITDLFVPFEGYGKSNYKVGKDVILPVVEDKYKAQKITSDFYLLASPFNDISPAVLIGKYESINSEIYYDGNNTIDLNLYVEEKDGQFFYRTRTKQMPYPDEANSVRFFPKQEDITMDIMSTLISGANDKVRVRLNVFNNTEQKFIIFADDSSERVSVIVKEGRVTTVQKTLN